MEWERAKTFIIVFFVLLNTVLAVFMVNEHRRYTVTSEPEAVIHAVLAENRIIMYTNMIRRFPPMRTLLLSGYYYNEEMLLEIFFDGPSRVVREEDEWGVFFSCGEGIAELWISDGFVTYINPYGMGGTPEEFIAQHFPDFVHDTRFAPRDDEGERMIFRQVYRGFTVYSNEIDFTITEAGIITIGMQFGYIHGWYGPERAIFAPDEVLITFLQHVRNLRDEPVTVWHMDIVYLVEFENASDEVGSTHQAVPFYRIFTHEFDMPLLINAYLNVSIDV